MAADGLLKGLKHIAPRIEQYSVGTSVGDLDYTPHSFGALNEPRCVCVYVWLWVLRLHVISVQVR